MWVIFSFVMSAILIAVALTPGGWYSLLLLLVFVLWFVGFGNTPDVRDDVQNPDGSKPLRKIRVLMAMNLLAFDLAVICWIVNAKSLHYNPAVSILMEVIVVVLSFTALCVYQMGERIRGGP